MARIGLAKPKKVIKVFLEKKDGSTYLLDVFSSNSAAEKYIESFRHLKIDGKVTKQEFEGQSS